MKSKIITPTGMQLIYKKFMSFVVLTFFLEIFDHRLSGCRSYLSLEHVRFHAASLNDILDGCPICCIKIMIKL